MHYQEFILSDYGRASSIPSPVNRMMTAFAADFRQDVDINLGVGYVNERTIPRGCILDAMREVLAHPERYRTSLNYGGAKGSANLIGSIRRFCEQNHIGGLSRGTLDRYDIIIGPNGATSLLEGVASVLEPGIVITSDPMYYIYCNFLERRGFEVVTAPEDSDGIRIDVLEQKLKALGGRKEAIRFFYIVTVSNPTGTILSNSRRAEIVCAAASLSREIRRKIPVIFDRAYEDLVHDPAVLPLKSGLLSDEDGLVYEIGTLSKILAPALRIGYMIGADSPFLRAMVQKTSDAGFSAPLITQEIASYLLDHHVADQIASVNAGYREKAVQVKRRIDETVGAALENCSGGQAGFYFYLTFRDTETTENSPFFRYLARTTGDSSIDGPSGGKNPRVVYVPGEFCVHPKGDMVGIGKRQLRLSYGFEETARIHEALGYMHEAVAYAGERRDKRLQQISKEAK